MSQDYTICTVGTLYMFHSLFHCSHLLKSKNVILFLINVHAAAHLDRKKLKCRHFCKCIKKEKLKYHMVISIQVLGIITV